MTEVAAQATHRTDFYDLGSERSVASTRTWTYNFLDGDWTLTHNQVVSVSDEIIRKGNQEALHQQRDVHEEQKQQQKRDHQRNLCAEASFLACQLSPPLNAEFGPDYNTPAEKDEFQKVQIEQLAKPAEEMMEFKRNLYIQEAGEELR